MRRKVRVTPSDAKRLRFIVEAVQRYGGTAFEDELASGVLRLLQERVQAAHEAARVVDDLAIERTRVGCLQAELRTALTNLGARDDEVGRAALFRLDALVPYPPVAEGRG